MHHRFHGRCEPATDGRRRPRTRDTDRPAGTRDGLSRRYRCDWIGEWVELDDRRSANADEYTDGHTHGYTRRLGDLPDQGFLGHSFLSGTAQSHIGLREEQ